MNEDRVSIILSSIIGSITIVDFKTILDIVLLILSILNILFIITIKIYKAYKNDGKIDKNEIDDILKDTEEIKKKVSEHEDGRKQK